MNAEQALKAALKLNNKSAVIHNNFGSGYFSQRNFDAAIIEYTQAIKLNSRYSEAWFNRALAYYAQGNLVQALLNIKETYGLNPVDATTAELYNKLRSQSR